MSAETRAEIAAAANTVDGIHCSPHFRQTTKPGDAMVRLDRRRRDDTGFGWITTWQVLLVLPADLAQSEKYLDQHADDLADALGEALTVTTVTPQQLALDSGTVPVVIFEGTRAT